MTVCDNRTLRKRAAESLERAQYSPRRVLLIHTGVAVGMSLLLLVLDYLVSKGISGTGGIGGIGTRSVLQTLQQLLLIVNLVILPFWEQGIRAWSLGISREQPVGLGSLLDGFRRCWPLLRLTVLRSMILFLLAFPCSMLASMIFSATPAARPMMEAMLPLMEDPEAMMDMEAVLAAIPESVVTDVGNTMSVILLILMGLTGLPILYLFRLADLAILDKPGTRAREAMGISFRAVRKDFWRLLKMDLSFWWYYGGLILLLAVANLDVLLPMVGITLPVSAEVAYFGSAILYGLGTLALYTFARGTVEVSYARVYDLMKEA